MFLNTWAIVYSFVNLHAELDSLAPIPMACWGIASYIAKHKNLPSIPLSLEYYIPLFTLSDTSELKPAL